MISLIIDFLSRFQTLLDLQDSAGLILVLKGDLWVCNDPWWSPGVCCYLNSSSGDFNQTKPEKNWNLSHSDRILILRPDRCEPDQRMEAPLPAHGPWRGGSRNRLMWIWEVLTRPGLDLEVFLPPPPSLFFFNGSASGASLPPRPPLLHLLSSSSPSTSPTSLKNTHFSHTQI